MLESIPCVGVGKRIETFPVEVEINCGCGDTVIVIVGLPDAAVKESRDAGARCAVDRAAGNGEVERCITLCEISPVRLLVPTS